LRFASDIECGNIRKKAHIKRRSGCPLNASLEMLGDRWSLLIIRDMMLRDAKTYKDFLACGENIATNVLADRLRRLMAERIISVRSDPNDGRKQVYRLTKKGIDLAPVLTEMVLWASLHGETGNPALVRRMQQDKGKFLADVKARWAASLLI
jgi:DNA-binding HxlR family transcriptional regulator